MYYVVASKVKDRSSKLIFSDPILCAQFMRGYVDIPILKDVQLEDIEDVTNRYLHMFTEERNYDSGSRVKTRINGMPFLIIFIIEHMPNVDYNVVMQIWTASNKLHDRILFSDVFSQYIPDCRCMLIKLSDYTNAELMEKRDELSVIMMVDRLRNASDYTKLVQEVSSDFRIIYMRSRHDPRNICWRLWHRLWKFFWLS